MRKSLLVLCCVFLLFSCAEKYRETGTSIVEKSIEAHGGWDSYKALEQISFDKTTWLFSEDSVLESEQIQRQEFRLQPNFLLRMSWQQDSTAHAIFYDQMNVEVYEDSLEVRSPEQIVAAKNLGASAVYVFFQPFKLISDKAILDYRGTTQLFDSLQVKEVAVSYPNDISNLDQWTYYFDTSYRLVAAKVAHEDRTSLILNTSFQEYKGVLFNKTRASYFVDSLGRKDYLRARYYYNLLE